MACGWIIPKNKKTAKENFEDLLRGFLWVFLAYAFKFDCMAKRSAAR